MEKALDINEIMKILPHREPFLFVDRITHLEKGKRAVGIKNVTINDYFFRGHFPGRPVMPGVIIIEAMAQVGGVMMLASEENKGKLAFFLSIDNVKFRKPVVPGDRLQLVFSPSIIPYKAFVAGGALEGQHWDGAAYSPGRRLTVEPAAVAAAWQLYFVPHHWVQLLNKYDELLRKEPAP